MDLCKGPWTHKLETCGLILLSYLYMIEDPFLVALEEGNQHWPIQLEGHSMSDSQAPTGGSGASELSLLLDFFFLACAKWVATRHFMTHASDVTVFSCLGCFLQSLSIEPKPNDATWGNSGRRLGNHALLPDTEVVTWKKNTGLLLLWLCCQAEQTKVPSAPSWQPSFPSLQLSLKHQFMFNDCHAPHILTGFSKQLQVKHLNNSESILWISKTHKLGPSLSCFFLLLFDLCHDERVGHPRECSCLCLSPFTFQWGKKSTRLREPNNFMWQLACLTHRIRVANTVHPYVSIGILRRNQYVFPMSSVLTPLGTAHAFPCCLLLPTYLEEWIFAQLSDHILHNIGYCLFLEASNFCGQVERNIRMWPIRLNNCNYCSISMYLLAKQ